MCFVWVWKRQGSYPWDLKNCSSMGSVFNRWATVLATWQTSENMQAITTNTITPNLWLYFKGKQKQSKTCTSSWQNYGGLRLVFEDFICFKNAMEVKNYYIKHISLDISVII